MKNKIYLCIILILLSLFLIPTISADENPVDVDLYPDT